MDIFKRDLAPVPDEAWEEINETANQVLKANLSARQIVDFDGPRGWKYAGVPLGRLDDVQEKGPGEVNYGVRTMQPLVEARVLFDFDVWELDNAVRGADDIDLEPLENAARKLARFEEKAVYDGFEAGGIKGLKESSEHETQKFTGEARSLLSAVSAGLTDFSRAGVEGPYRLVCGPDLWQHVSSENHGYPLTRHLRQLVDSDIILNPFLEDTILVSVRGGDMKLTVGVDFSVGFNSADANKVRLFLTETFTFRVLDGAAIVPIQWNK